MYGKQSFNLKNINGSKEDIAWKVKDMSGHFSEPAYATEVGFE